VDEDLLPYLKFLPRSRLEPTASVALRASRSEDGERKHDSPPQGTFREGFVSVEIQNIRARNKERRSRASPITMRRAK